MLDTHHESEILDLYEIALLLNYERTSSEPRFRYTKLREVASHELDFQTLLINTPIWTAHKGPKDGFVFQRMEPAVIADSGSREVPDLPSNMLPQIVYPLARDISQLAPDRLETIYWQARGHDSCFKSVAILQHFFDLYTTDPNIRIRLADGKEYFSSPSTRSIIEYELLTVQRLTIAVVLPENKAYATGSADQPRFKHAVVVFESHSYNGGVQTVLDLASMQFGDTGRGPGHSGKGTLVLESLDDYHDRLSSVAAGFRTTKISYHITPDPEAGSSRKEALPRCLRKPLPHSQTAATRVFRSRLEKRHDKLWRESPRYQAFQRIDPGSATKVSRRYWKLARWLPRPILSILTQLRTGHIPIQKHLHRIGKADTPLCPCCRNEPETVRHFLLECPAHRRAREKMQWEMSNLHWGLGPMLTSRKALPALFRFINTTERLRHIYGELPRLKEDEEE